MLNYFLIRVTGITSINYKIKKFSFQKMEQCKTNVSNYILCADNKKWPGNIIPKIKEKC